MSAIPDSTLADCEQLIADLQRQLAERTAERDEALEYQTATSDVLKVIARSTSDVQAVLDTVAETASRLCGADDAGITIREGEIYRYVATHGHEPEFWASVSQRSIVPGRETISGRVALEGGVVHVADVSADPDYGSPEAVASGRRSYLGVPLRREGPCSAPFLSRGSGSSRSPSGRSSWCAPSPTRQ
jgi:two-component system, NtrC family, sensor kinase